MKGYWEILRPLNCLMAGLAVAGGAVIAAQGAVEERVFLAVGAAFLICGAGNVVNDCYDVAIDRVNRPSRPLPSGKISLRKARLYALFLFLSGVLLSAFINALTFGIALLNSLLLYAYGWRLKRRGGLTKGLTVSYLVASPFLFGGAAVGNPSVLLLLVLCAALANMGREIVKDIEDFEGDRGLIPTLPGVWGVRTSARVAVGFLWGAVLISPLPYLLGLLGIYYLAVVWAADLLLVWTGIDFLREVSSGTARRAQKWIKGAMALALLAFFAGAAG
jgi:geranylgeranylglycerol-phosphate geranylgeranyltransferase